MNIFYKKKLSLDVARKKKQQTFPLKPDVHPDGEVTSDLVINYLIIKKKKSKKYFPSLLVD